MASTTIATSNSTINASATNVISTTTTSAGGSDSTTITMSNNSSTTTSSSTLISTTTSALQQQQQSTTITDRFWAMRPPERIGNAVGVNDGYYVDDRAEVKLNLNSYKMVFVMNKDVIFYKRHSLLRAKKVSNF